ncbi:MAG: acetyl-CoA C-acyltransferase, partial [Actinophytocola sp.]|nr:acetyl-CoA C-acyltransferase [Actinophytocola sp.]
MNDVVISEPIRTPVGRFGGAFSDIPAADLASTVISELMRRTGVPAGSVEDVILGQCYPNGEAPAIGRVAALDAGLPVSVPGVQVDRRCGSGLQAVLDAAMRVQTGVHNLVMAGGVESMSTVEFYTDRIRWGVRGSGVELRDRIARGRVTAGGVNHPVPGGMLETAENLRREYRIGRQEQDELAVRSHRRAIAAAEDGRFVEEIVPVTVPGKRGSAETVVDTDEHPRADASLDALAGLRPVMAKQDPDATVTAGNASGQNDAAAACLVSDRATAESLGLRPFARLVSWAVAGVPPSTMGIGPVPATDAALDRAGLRLSD